MKVLVTGADGQLGKSIASISENFEGMLFFTSRKDLDICDPESIRSTIETYKPDYIVNCAAYTAVDKAENEEELATQINRDAVINLIKESEADKTKIIHISTDYVFNGNNDIPYIENDKIDPQSVYGKTKAAGEKALSELASDRSIVIRTSWLYSEFGHNFLKTMIRLGKERSELNVVSDQKGIPTYTKDLAKAIFTIIEQNPEISDTNRILHFSNKEESNWSEFAKEIMKLEKLDCKINEISTAEFPTPAQRPAYSVLSTKRIETEFGIIIRHWKTALKECVERLNKIEK